MPYRLLGRSGLAVSRLALGTMTFGGAGTGWANIGTTDQAEAERMIRVALDRGVNLFDTANVYADGAAEGVLGAALRGLGVPRTDIVVATKAAGESGPGPNDRGASRAHLLDSLAASLARLQMDYVDLFQLHCDDPATPLDETLATLEDLVRRGSCRYVGCSNWSAWRTAAATQTALERRWSPFVSAQVFYSLAARDIEREIMPMARSQGLGIIAWAPLAGGLLTGKFRPDAPPPAEARRAISTFPRVPMARAWRCLEVLDRLAKTHDAEVGQVALAWMLAQPDLTSVLVGARDAAQLALNLEAVDLELSADELAVLDDVSALDQEYPAWMFDLQNAGRIAR